MWWPGRAATDRIADERGFTLPELLVATALSMIVIGAGVTVFTASLASQARVQSQSAAIQQARTVMERMVRELRQGSSVPSATSSQLAVITYVRDATCGTTTPVCRVTYQCVTAGTCTRTVSRPDGTSPATPVRMLSGLSSPNVFTYTPPTTTTPASVAVTLSLPAKNGGNAITLTDSATLRNPSTS
jgi:prepilin-type N-terminal cleavage/methylation domain-containing protein